MSRMEGIDGLFNGCNGCNGWQFGNGLFNGCNGWKGSTAGESAIKNVLTVWAVAISLLLPVFTFANHSEESHDKFYYCPFGRFPITGKYQLVKFISACILIVLADCIKAYPKKYILCYSHIPSKINRILLKS